MPSSGHENTCFSGWPVICERCQFPCDHELIGAEICEGLSETIHRGVSGAGRKRAHRRLGFEVRPHFRPVRAKIRRGALGRPAAGDAIEVVVARLDEEVEAGLAALSLLDSVASSTDRELYSSRFQAETILGRLPRYSVG